MNVRDNALVRFLSQPVMLKRAHPSRGLRRSFWWLLLGLWPALNVADVVTTAPALAHGAREDVSTGRSSTGQPNVPRWERRLRWVVGVAVAFTLLLWCGAVVVLPDALWADARFDTAPHAVVDGVTVVTLPLSIVLIGRALGRVPAMHGRWGVRLIALSGVILLVFYAYQVILNLRDGLSDDPVAVSRAFSPVAFADFGLFLLGTLLLTVGLGRQIVAAVRREPANTGADGQAEER